MLFSIVIPVYNAERHLPRCLDSLVAQTDGDFEVVVVDDGSPGSESKPKNGETASEIVSHYDSRFSCIVHETNRSAFQARRTGLSAAKGDYVVPVDPDDYLMPETLAKLREVIGREAPDMISYWIDYDDGEKVTPHWCRHPAATVSGVEALRELTESRYFTGVASKAFRRVTLVSAVRELDAPETLYVNTADDFLMLVPMLMKCARVSFLDYAGYRYFVNRRSTSFGWRSRQGFERGLAQMRQADGLIRRRAERADVPAEVRRLVEQAVAGVEDWFVQSYRESTFLVRLKGSLSRLFRRRKP